MPLELSVIAGEFTRFAGHQTSPAAGVAADAAQRQRWSRCPRTWARSWRLKVVVRARPGGASFGIAGRSLSEVCLPNSAPGLLGVPSPRARVGCPACSEISYNTLKFIDLDQASFSRGEAERPRTDSRLLGSSPIVRQYLSAARSVGTRPVLRPLHRPVCFRKRLVQCGGEGLGLPFLRVHSTQIVFRASNALPDRPTGSPRWSRSTTGISLLRSWRPT
jgi:hypothetical protein